MILSSGVVLPLKWPSRNATIGRRASPKPLTTSAAAAADTEQLRKQLNQLQAEAELTRSKANSARLRLLRLSEAAENLQQRAATKILVNKETEARELLIQKKKLMQALEKLKNRIEVLDELTVKINEAISLKETQLIGNVGMHPEVEQAESGPQIHFVSPKDDNVEDISETGISHEDYTKQGQNYKSETQKWEEVLSRILREPSSEKMYTSSDDYMIRTFEGISTYEGFLEYVDEKLREVESDLFMFVKISSFILGSEQEQMKSKVQQTSEILEDVRSIRERIASIIKTKEGNT